MKKDLLKIKRHSSELFLKRNQTIPKDVKLHNDVEVSLSCSMNSNVPLSHSPTKDGLFDGSKSRQKKKSRHFKELC